MLTALRSFGHVSVAATTRPNNAAPGKKRVSANMANGAYIDVCGCIDMSVVVCVSVQL